MSFFSQCLRSTRERERVVCMRETAFMCLCNVKIYEYEERGCEFVHVSSRENEVCVYVCLHARWHRELKTFGTCACISVHVMYVFAFMYECL